MSCCRFACYVLVLSCFFPTALHGQRNLSGPALNRVSRQAAYIFSGTVLAVERLTPKGPNDIAAVQITFRVDQPIRGVTAKQTFSIREWAGLWDRNDRYRRGQHVLLFLYRPSKLGLTSPVGGGAGRYELDGTGRILGNPNSLEEMQALLRTSGKREAVNARDLVRAIRRPRGE